MITNNPVLIVPIYQTKLGQPLYGFLLLNEDLSVSEHTFYSENAARSKWATLLNDDKLSAYTEPFKRKENVDV